ncbi:MAG: flagellar motor switch protein FliM [Gammaproteobacteria bacterium]|nr:flagellar motor switch protein FliM [Gammaproteobacteria bacterium]
MSTDILSQDEIDALLTGVDSGDVETESDVPVSADDVKTYDFNSQDRIVRGRMPTLEMINERFARNFRISLFNFLRRAPAITVDGVQMTKFGEYIHSLFMPSNLNLVKIRPLRGTALFVLNPKLVYSLVDNFFGGDGRYHTKIEGRDFTQTEMQVINNVLQMIFVDLRKAWQPVLDVNFEHSGSEVNPNFANIVSPTEVVIVSTIHIELDNGGGDMHLTLPYSMIEPIRDLLDAGVQSDVSDYDERWISSLRDEIKNAPVTVSCNLAEIDISLGDLKKMNAGDVIPITMPERVLATIDDIPVFRAQYGISRGNHALKVTEMIRHDKLSTSLSLTQDSSHE